MHKRAFAVQFNWIFILIAGGLILLFFFAVIRGCQRGGEEAIDAQVTIDLGNVISSAEKSKGTLFKVEIRDTGLSYECPYLRVGETGGRIRMDTSFGPDRLESVQDNFFIMSLDWSMPFKIQNLLYLSSPDIRYIIIEDQVHNYHEALLEDPYHYTFPQNMTPEVYPDCSLIADIGDYKVRFIFFDQINQNCTNAFSSMDRKDLTAIKIDSLSQGLDGDPIGGYGKVDFYMFDKASQGFAPAGPSSYYLGRELLMGAIMTEDPLSYQCALRNSLNRLNVISKVYENRTLSLNNNLTAEGCFDKSGYVNAAVELQEIIRETQSLGSISQDQVQEIFTAAGRIQSYNTQLMHASCPLIY